MVNNSALTAQDRCDRCSAQAQARTLHDQPTGDALPLLWCVHHFKDHRTPLTPLLVFMTPEIAKSKEPVA